MKPEMTIGELAKAAGVTTRTVRFYVSEGLLPAPEAQGSKNVYSAGHLTALRLIASMKANFLPLWRIGQEISGMSEEQMEALLKEIAEKKKQGSYAIGEMFPSPPSIIRDPQAGMVKEEHAPYGDRTAVNSTHGDLPPPEYIMTTENWKKIKIRDGVELHFKATRDPRKLEQLQQIAGYATTLLVD